VLGLRWVAPHAGSSVGRRASSQRHTIARTSLPPGRTNPSSSIGSNNPSPNEVPAKPPTTLTQFDVSSCTRSTPEPCCAVAVGITCAATYPTHSPMPRSARERHISGLRSVDTIHLRSGKLVGPQFTGAREADATRSSCCSNLRIQSAVTA